MIAFEGAFHGRTLLALSLTSKVAPYKAGLGPFAPEVYRVPFPNAYRGVSSHDALDALERAFRTLVAAETVAAIVLEPVQGEGGFIVAPPEFLQGVRRLCDRARHRLRRRRGADRVRRAPAASSRSSTPGVEPDLICVAKSIANGLPLSGVLGRAAIMDAAGPGAVGGTFVGNPVAQAAALAVLDVIDEEGLRRALGRDRRDDPRAHAGLAGALAARSATCAASARCSRSSSSPIRATATPAKELAQRVIDAALARGLLLLSCGVYGNCIRVLVPLVITDAELAEALAVWEDALAHVLG